MGSRAKGICQLLKLGQSTGTAGMGVLQRNSAVGINGVASNWLKTDRMTSGIGVTQHRTFQTGHAKLAETEAATGTPNPQLHTSLPRMEKSWLFHDQLMKMTVNLVNLFCLIIKTRLSVADINLRHFKIQAVNQITLMGRVGGDPQKRGSSEHPVVVFSMATHSNYNYQSGKCKNNTFSLTSFQLLLSDNDELNIITYTGGILQKTDWHRICVFKPYLREVVYKYMHKGQRVYVTGRLSYGEVKDESGNPHTTTSVIADDVIFVSNAPGKVVDVE